MTSTPSPRAWPGWIAWAFWFLCFAVIIGDVVHKPKQRTTTPTYRFATTEWWKGEDPYTFDRRESLPIVTAETMASPTWYLVQHDDFVYFPQAALFFTPYNALPFMLGEILWRATTFGLFAYALVRLHKMFLPDEEHRAKNFALLSLLAIPSAFASLRNAQFDLPLAALLVLATAEIAAARWTPAALWLCLALALKPLAAVPLLLFGALYWRLIPRIVIGLMIVAALPFLHWSPAYVAHEYVRCAQALTWAAGGEAPKFSDLSALLAHFGYAAPDPLKTAARALFAVVFLGLGWTAQRNLSRVGAAWAVGALCADYLMLFNPRTETCSFVLLGPFLASIALLYVAEARRRWLGYALAFGALGLACDAIPVVHGLTDRWFKPLIALLFLPVLVSFIFQNTKASLVRRSSTSATA